MRSNPAARTFTEGRRVLYHRCYTGLNLGRAYGGITISVTPPTTGPPPVPQDHPRWGDLALLRLSAYGFGINGLLLAMDVMILPALLLVLTSDDLKNTYLGLLGFSGLVLAALVQLSIAPMSDRSRSSWGKRVPFIIWGSVLVCAGLVGIGLAPNYALLFAAWLFLQGTINVGYGPYQALIQDLVPLRLVGRAASYKILADAAGALALILVAGELIGLASGTNLRFWIWMALVVLAACVAVNAGITSVTVVARGKPQPVEDPVPQPKPPRVRPEPRPALHPQLTRFVLSRLMLVIGIAAFQTYGMFFLKDVVGLENPAQTLGRMTMVIGGGLAVSVFLTGRISDRVDRKPLMLVGALGAAASTISLLAANDVTDVLVLGSATGISVGMLLSANWALANEMGTTGREAQHMGIINLANIGGAGISKLLGPGIDALNHLEPHLQLLGNSYTVTGYSAMLIGCGVMFVSGALLVMPLDSKKRRTQSPNGLPQDST